MQNRLLHLMRDFAQLKNGVVQRYVNDEMKLRYR